MDHTEHAQGNTHTSQEQGIFAFFDTIWARKTSFLFVFFILFSISYGFLVYIDFVPEEPKAEPVAAVLNATSTEPFSNPSEKPSVTVLPKENPTHISIEKINVSVPILNPESTDITVLDEALLSGAVRYPGSATFEKPGTMVLFGHSSYLPKVLNKNFKAFNGIQHLVVGDIVQVASAQSLYTYRVTKVYKAAASQASVAIGHEKNALVLVTCNSFGSKDDRYVVEADFVEKKAL